jgi:AcrR family transcriptional regulator
MPRELGPSDTEDFRDRVCDAALQIFAEKGVHGLTMRDVAARLGVSPMIPYRYFKDKDDILAVVRARAFNDFAQALETAAQRGGDAVARSNAVGKAYQDFAFNHTAAYQLMFIVFQQDAEEKDLALQTAFDRARATISHHVEQMAKAGLMKGDAGLIGYSYWAAMHGLVMLQLSGKFTSRYDFKAVRHATLAALMEGFRRGDIG